MTLGSGACTMAASNGIASPRRHGSAAVLVAQRRLLLFPTVVGVMFAVGLLAAAGPARRGLTVQPTEALRNEQASR